ncbi:concanavalin A-like lectin/glucanase domain-containing protein [Gigaspora rosea]|uniref:Concanavalin A-like lectin/glucanase domain-containing protein n=1 Tax=Gigaspora rosea TaxID=44941 RepID=A0A397TV61_9GLOM|nr:concanavalin A-like lectin/glucanase domain-containing protein [Gigaspora rosea]RIB03072.1 concanavalin A-like lectin/glucanase domain-containing protein [Gigaspora rosea]CAG8470015.1 7950_t:CDS:2 [Gigaspora rosea]
MRMNYYYFYFLVIIIVTSSISVFCQKQEQRTYRELITEPVLFTPEYNRVINHSELPVVIDELSITLKLYIGRHNESYQIFCKGKTRASRAPELWLNRDNSTPSLGFSITGDSFVWIKLVGYEFQLYRWYHIAYTLSDSEKRIYFYIDGKWIGSYSIIMIQCQSFIFNDEPLYIGKHPLWSGFLGQISNFRYYNFRLSHEEVLMDYTGEDPTKSIDKEYPNKLNKFFDGLGVGLAVGFFLGMIALAGGLYIYRIISRRKYQAIPNPIE